MASLKWLGHVFGKSTQFVACQLSSPISGAQSHANTYNRILLVPFTKPLTHGEYTATM